MIALAAKFDAFLIDQFGVLLNGNGAYPFAPAALSKLAATGKPILLLSNSGKRAAPNEARLTKLGFNRTDYIGVLSSGEAAYTALQRRIGHTIAMGAKTWVHARDNDTSAIDGLNLTPTASPDTADLIVLAGSQGDTQTLDQYEALLHKAATRHVPLLCTNPDIEMLTPTGTHFGAGRIAMLYQSLGGPVEWIGKPHPLIYAEAARHLPGIPAARILCIGDSPAHDIAGGHASGHATALVRTGIHATMTDAELHALCATEHAIPDFILPRFDFTEAP